MRTDDSDSPAPSPSLLRTLLELSGLGAMDRAASTPAGSAAREFFLNGWLEAEEGLLARSSIVRVTPRGLPAPTAFELEFDVPYKRQRPDGEVELAPGPLRGALFYRSDPFDPEIAGTQVQVLLEDHSLLHPNFSRRYGALCLGALPPALSLEPLLELLYAIVSYQELSVDDPADAGAAAWFRASPDAFNGLDHPLPLY